jgi:rhamnose transport system permease protein
MSATTPTTPATGRESEGGGTLANPRSLVDFVLRARTFGIVGILALLVVVTTLIQSSFLSGSNIRFILSDAAVYALVAIGETFVVLTRNVDLSVGSVVGLSAYVSANMFQTHHGIAIPVVFLVGLGVGLACGAVTGLITAIGRVPSLVVTLAMLYIIRGVDTIIVGSSQVVANSLPNSFINIFHASVIGIPDLAIVVAVAVAGAAYYLRSYRSGRDLYAIGSDPEAARLAGIPIAKRVFFAFVLSGAIAGLAGVVWSTQ